MTNLHPTVPTDAVYQMRLLVGDGDTFPQASAIVANALALTPEQQGEMERQYCARYPSEAM